MFAIDAHHHIWNPSQGDFSWMTPAHAPIDRVFDLNGLRPELEAAQVDRTVLVQTWSSIEETEMFLNLAQDTDFIAGVVGWVDLTVDVPDQLDRFYSRPSGRFLKGIRHQVHDELDSNWLLRPEVQVGLEAIARRDLAYDLLVRPRELNSACRSVVTNPEMRFVVDHIGKPCIADGWDSAWADGIRKLAEHRDHVWIKLSGMVTEADWSAWSPEDIAPYIHYVLDNFGPDRVMIGSDWPVCTLAASYGDTLGLVRNSIGGLAEADQRAILRGSAIEAYRLAL